jgi:hypothetical protein
VISLLPLFVGQNINAKAPPKFKRRLDVKISKIQVMSTHASVLVDSVGPPSAEVCRTAASFP